MLKRHRRHVGEAGVRVVVRIESTVATHPDTTGLCAIGMRSDRILSMSQDQAEEGLAASVLASAVIRARET